jgi:hypothetical protein
MKTNNIYFRILLLLIFADLFIQTEVFSQGTNISRSEQSKLFVGISFVPSQSQILNEGTISGSKLLSGKMNSFSGSLDAGYFFSDYIGLSSGLGINSYKTQLNIDSYQNSFSATDSENESYTRRVSGNGIKEIQNISALSIPFYINFRLPLIKSIGFFLQSGLNMSIPLSKNYTSSGTFSYKGYYAIDNVLIENLPDYGFPSNVSGNTDGKLTLKSLAFDFVASAGLSYFIQEKFQLALAASFDKSLSNISGYSSPDVFSLSTDPNQINSLMGGSTKATLSSVGLMISFRYYLR